MYCLDRLYFNLISKGVITLGAVVEPQRWVFDVFAGYWTLEKGFALRI